MDNKVTKMTCALENLQFIDSEGDTSQLVIMKVDNPPEGLGMLSKYVFMFYLILDHQLLGDGL